MNLILNISFHFDYLPLLVVAALAWLIPMTLSLARLKKVPSVIVEIILGYFIGRYLLGSPEQESYRILEFLALTGFIFLMFMSGLEINVDQIIASFPRKKLTYSRFLKNPLLIGITFFIITLILSYFGAVLLSSLVNFKNHWYFALIMVTTSVGIILPVLKNRGEISGRFGQMMIIAAAVADIFSIILFTFTAFIIKSGFKIEIVLIFALFAIFFIFYRLGNRFVKVHLFKKIGFQLSHAASQLSIRGSMLLILIFVVLSQYIGEEVILLGAFLSGLLLSVFLHKERSLLMVKLDGMGFGFFIPVFFIMVGAKFDPAALLEFDKSLVLFLVLLLITLFAVKIIPAFLWSRLFGYKKAVAGGFLMASRLSLIIAASAIGLELGIISPGINSCFIIMAVVTCLLSPVFYNYLNPGDVFTGDKTIIIGGSSTGVLLARRLKVHGKAALIVEKNIERCKEMRSKGLDVVSGDGLDVEMYNKIKLAPVNYVVVETGDDKLNVKICELLRKELRHEKIISRARNLAIEKTFKSLEVETIDATRVLATTIENLIVRPTTYHTLVETFENFTVEEITITNKEVDGLRVKEIPFHKDAILMMVKRGNNFYIPHGDTYFRIGDTIHIFGTDSALEDTRRKLK
ncbi:MAG: cation:proton antiporter [Bacteroidetes bacterium]|nr:cation:proton antiporter [Bacteroidota bacterium]MBL7104894.1 cation:proton antiporter [Bacteroidales bacterium]